jgi:hypothetical protein
MTMLARIEVECNGEKHHISVYDPDDSKSCGSEHTVVASNGNIICYEDHDPDIEMTVADLTGDKYAPCLTLLGRFDNYPPSVIDIKAPLADTMINTVRFLYYSGADFSTMNDYAIWQPARDGHMDVVRFLFEKGFNLFVDENWPLKISAKEGHLDVVKFLVHHGADIHDGEDAAFRWAVQSNRTNVANFLLKKGVNIHALNDDAFIWARKNNNKELIDLLDREVRKERSAK